MERQAKVKSIERKLDQHKKMMEVRMNRFRLKKEVLLHSRRSKTTMSLSTSRQAPTVDSSETHASTDLPISAPRAHSSARPTIGFSEKSNVSGS
jgi:hypothetical protein